MSDAMQDIVDGYTPSNDRDVTATRHPFALWAAARRYFTDQPHIPGMRLRY